MYLLKPKLYYSIYLHGGLKWIVNGKHAAKIQAKTIRRSYDTMLTLVDVYYKKLSKSIKV